MLSKNGSFESSAKLNGNGGGALWSVGFPGILAVNGMVNGFDFITDGGFDAVAESEKLTTANAAILGNEADGVAGWQNLGAVTLTSTNAQANNGIYSMLISDVDAQYDGVNSENISVVAGAYYHVKVSVFGDATNAFWVRVSPAASGVIYLNSGGIAGDVHPATWTTYEFYFNPEALDRFFSIEIRSGSGVTAGSIYIDSVSAKEVRFTNWTAGTGWAPQVTAGALTGKAQKIAGTASDLEQNIGTKRHTSYLLKNEIVRTAGLANPEIGGIDGNIIAVSGTHYDTIITKTTGNLKLQADATFAGNVDNLVGRTQGPLRINGK